MVEAAFQCFVSSGMDKLWKVLLDEIEHPDRYNSGIRAVEILERFHNGILRRVSVPDADIRERVVFAYKDHKIVSTLVGHPQIEGSIMKSIKKADQGLELRCSLKWQSIDAEVDQMLRRNVRNFIMDGLDQVKVFAENPGKL